MLAPCRRLGHIGHDLGGEDELSRRRASNAAGLERLAAALREHGLEPVPSVGNFVYAETGADFLSSGALTHSAPGANLSLLVESVR